METDTDAKTIFDILRDYYGELRAFLEQSDRDLTRQAPSVATMIEAHEAAFARTLYPRFSRGPAAQCASIAPIQAGHLASLLRSKEAGRHSAIRRMVEGYLVRVHQPIVVAAKMHFGWSEARTIGREVWRSLCHAGAPDEAAA